MKTFLGYLARLAVFAALVAAAGFLYLRAYSIDPAQREITVNLLRDLKQINSDWNADVLRSKSGISKDYDAITLPERTALQVLDRIGQQGLVTFDFRLKDGEALLRDTLAAKIDLIDQFKAQNAIMRNSLRFIPSATEDLKAKAREAGDAAPQKRAQMAALASAAEQVLVDALKLETAGNREAVRALQRAIGAMVVNRAEYPPAVAESFDVFSRHVIQIAAQKEREEELLDQLDKLPLAERTDALDRSFRTAFDRANAEREAYRIALFAYSGVLLALLAFFVGRLGRRGRRLAATA